MHLIPTIMHPFTDKTQKIYAGKCVKLMKESMQFEHSKYAARKIFHRLKFSQNSLREEIATAKFVIVFRKNIYFHCF